jgi:hypothetical protein
MTTSSVAGLRPAPTMAVLSYPKAIADTLVRDGGQVCRRI